MQDKCYCGVTMLKNDLERLEILASKFDTIDYDDGVVMTGIWEHAPWGYKPCWVVVAGNDGMATRPPPVHVTANKGEIMANRSPYSDIRISQLGTLAYARSAEARGLVMGPPLTPEELQRAYNDMVDQNQIVTAEVRDNGDSGDGLWLAFHHEARPSTEPLFAVEFSESQAEMLIEVLSTVLRQRAIRARFDREEA